MRILLLCLSLLMLTSCTMNITYPEPLSGPVMIVEPITETPEPVVETRTVTEYIKVNQVCRLPALDKLLAVPIPDKKAYAQKQDQLGYIQALKTMSETVAVIRTELAEEYQACLKKP